MTLFEWITDRLLPIFGSAPMETTFDLGYFGTLTLEQIVTLIFWIPLVVISVDLLLVLPYRWIKKLCGMRRRG